MIMEAGPTTRDWAVTQKAVEAHSRARRGLRNAQGEPEGAGLGAGEVDAEVAG